MVVEAATAHDLGIVTPRLHLGDGRLHVGLVVGTACQEGDIAEVPVGGVVAGTAVVALDEHAVAGAGLLLIELSDKRLPERLVRVGRYGSAEAKVVHHGVEAHGRSHVVALLIVVVDTVDERQRLLQCAEVAVERRLGEAAVVGIEDGLDIIVRVVAPAADDDLDAVDGGIDILERLDIFDVIGLCAVEDVFAVLTDGLAVGEQRAVGVHVHVEKKYVGEARFLEFGDRVGTLATDMSADIDAGPRHVGGRIDGDGLGFGLIGLAGFLGFLLVGQRRIVGEDGVNGSAGGRRDAEIVGRIVLGTLLEPRRRRHALGRAVAIDVQGILLHPRLVCGCRPAITNETPHMAHEYAFEARQVAILDLTGIDDSVAVAKVAFGPLDDLYGILLILLVAIILIQHTCRAEHRTLVVGRSPFVLGLHLLGLGIPHDAVPYLSC